MANKRARLAGLLTSNPKIAEQVSVNNAVLGGLLGVGDEPSVMYPRAVQARRMAEVGGLLGSVIPVDQAAMLGAKGVGLASIAAPTYFVRRTAKDTSPFNSVDYAMFLRSGDDVEGAFEKLGHYGANKWITTNEGAVPVEEIQADILRAIRRGGIHADYNTTAASLAREARPQNIVDSAGLWDNADLVSYIYQNVLDPRGILAVETPDGLISFDRSSIRKYK